MNKQIKRYRLIITVEPDILKKHLMRGNIKTERGVKDVLQTIEQAGISLEEMQEDV